MRNSVADLNGKIRKGDRLLAIQGEQCFGMPAATARQRLKDHSNEVK